MDIFKIEGPSYLEGTVHIQGSKNAALPMLAAALMTGAKTTIYNCPQISDIEISLNILRFLGCEVKQSKNTITIDSSGKIGDYIPSKMMQKLRSSFLFTGAVLARNGRIRAAYPGGCNIGKRPVDIHLDAFKQMSIDVGCDDDYLTFEAGHIKPCNVHLRFPSVGATENVMVLASSILGTTRIYGAACEPEIVDLQNLLCRMGADVRGAGTSVITIKGTHSFSDAEYAVMPDRIEAATFLTAVACTKGEIDVVNVNPNHLSSYIALMRNLNTKIFVNKNSINIQKHSRLKGGINARTLPYPGFATDTQSLLVATLATSEGVSTVSESIFENRFRLCSTLSDMGADIIVRGRTASVRGVKRLNGIIADATDLRSGAALTMAMLGAEGKSIIGNVEYIDRGYENFVSKLSAIGAKIERTNSLESKG